jgi:disulfide bond formation protein DsbB
MGRADLRIGTYGPAAARTGTDTTVGDAADADFLHSSGRRWARRAPMTDTVTLYLALLAILAELGVITALLLFAGSRLTDTGRRVAGVGRALIGPNALGLAFGVAAISMAGSLYFSEVAHFTPCRLCWYQRIAMYPLVPILALAAWKRDLHIRRYGILLAAIGGAISTYHVLLERFPKLETSVCEVANPCTLIWVKRFGYLTIPTMALSAFALIITLLAVAVPAGAAAVDPQYASDDIEEPSRGQAVIS